MRLVQLIADAVSSTRTRGQGVQVMKRQIGFRACRSFAANCRRLGCGFCRLSRQNRSPQLGRRPGADRSRHRPRLGTRHPEYASRRRHSHRYRQRWPRRSRIRKSDCAAAHRRFRSQVHSAPDERCRHQDQPDDRGEGNCLPRHRIQGRRQLSRHRWRSKYC